MKLLKHTYVLSNHDSHQPIKLKRFLRQVAVNFGGIALHKHYDKMLVINKPSACGASVDKLSMKLRYKGISLGNSIILAIILFLIYAFIKIFGKL